jgi:hypothetical protein
MADDVPGAGSGYRILQFTAPLSPGSSGGVLVDAEARILGIVVGSLSVGQNLNFAVPFDSIAGLGNASGGTRFDSGARLQPFSAKATSAAAAPSNPPAAVTRPFLIYDWIFKMISPKTGMVLGTGKVTAIDGPAAAQRLAIDIVNQIRSVRPVPATP